MCGTRLDPAGDWQWRRRDMPRLDPTRQSEAGLDPAWRAEMKCGTRLDDGAPR